MAASSKYKLIIGLGNSGEEYLDTYHNAGFLFIDYLKRRLEISTEGTTTIGRKKVFHFMKTPTIVLIKPITYMNESGNAVKKILEYYNISPRETLIVHDDSDIEIGNYKISEERGSAGHKGVESIVSSLGTNDLVRLRLGIRKNVKSGKRLKAEDLVLKNISKADFLLLEKVFEKATQEIIG